jgi:para-nitrobenzyl esterase
MFRSRFPAMFRRWLTATITTSITIVALLNVLTLPVLAQSRDNGNPIVRTTQGLLKGLTAENVQAFLGVPYAAAPVGNLRWQAPAPPPSWQGIRDATKQGSACPQLASSNGPTSTNEDCLYLNVYRPLQTSPWDRLPVFFWIHGGGFLNGTGNQFDGSTFASQNHAIVVTINYRLGVFGYLALPQLMARFPEVGEIGLLDQEAALRWTHRNIAAFGGDPGKVTIGGESAGGMSTCDLMASPQAAGLFRAAIIESGTCVTDTQAMAESAATAFAKAAGCGDAATTVACLTSKSASELLQAVPNFFSDPYPGSSVLPLQPYEAIERGTWNRVPVLMGQNHDEARIAYASLYPLSVQNYQQIANTLYGSAVSRVEAEYPLSNYSDPFIALGTERTDEGFASMTYVNAGIIQRAGVPIYEFEFDDPNPPAPATIAAPLGAYHSSELQFVWPGYYGDYARPLNASEQKLSQEIISYWGAFVRSGNPNYPSGAEWPQRRANNAVLSLQPGGNVVIHDFNAEHHVDFWRSVITIPSPGEPIF